MDGDNPTNLNMRMKLFFVAGLSATLAVTLIGCGKKADAASELQRAANEMGASSPEAPVKTSSSAAPTPVAAQPSQPPPAQQMNQAMVSYKSGNLEDAVTQLQKLRAQSAITPQQRMALQDAMAAVMTDIYARAAKGDARAQQAVKQYEMMQNAR